MTKSTNAGSLAGPVRGPTSLPPCRPRYAFARALYIERSGGLGPWRLRREKVYVRGDYWMVRREGELVRLDSQRPLPDALLLPDGTVESGGGGWWPDLASFARANGIDPKDLDIAA